MRSSISQADPQHLVFDGDDTLWQNNVYFEQAIDRFFELLDHSSLSPGETRRTLDEIEAAMILDHGYGARTFRMSLTRCFEKLVERDFDESEVTAVAGLADRILETPIELVEGAEEVLRYLAGRHRLFLLTKGAEDEQRSKIDKSGLAGYFSEVCVVAEKDVATYERLIEDHDLPKEETWMIGNSPRSDVNPALHAGLNAVYVPHPQTWHLEEEVLLSGPGRLLVVERLTDLSCHF